MNKQILQIGVGGTVVFAGGVWLGYILGSRRRKETIIVTKDKLENLTEQLELDFHVIEDSYDEEGHRVIEQAEIRSVDFVQLKKVEEDPPAEVIRPLVKFSDEDDWDYDEEIQYREQNENGPYVIHYDEYINNEMNFSQDTLTFFSGDDIVCDTRDIPMYGHHETLGELKFGHGSNDANIVYIRNVKMRQEWEVLFDSRKYEDVVSGLRMEEDLADRGFKHGTPRFRRMDY